VSRPLLYAIVDAGICQARGIEAAELAGAYLRGGARLLQLRWKGAPGAAFLGLAERVVAAAAAVEGARVIVNDRADIARLAGASGVHVGQEDLAPETVRQLLGPEAMVGLSTHDRPQVDAALATTATYIAVGPVFGTSTKDTGYDARGLDLVRYAAGRGKPVVAIGGMTLERARSVIDAGAWAVAVITDLMSDDPESRARAFLQALS
jgi:thiamine-phosphate pyrophosphorylase